MKKILIIEDESSMAKQLKWGLSDTYDIFTAKNAADAVHILHKESPLVVLLDLGLPPYPDSAEEGLRLLEEILSKKAQTKVIVITGNTDRINAVKAVSLALSLLPGFLGNATCVGIAPVASHWRRSLASSAAL